MATIIGTAYIRVIPDTTGFRTKLKAELNKLKDDIRISGREAGTAYGQEFQRSIKASMDGLRADARTKGLELGQVFGSAMGDGTHRSLNASLDRVGARAQQAGEAAGRQWGRGFKDTATAETAGLVPGKGSSDAAEREGRKAGGRYGNAAVGAAESALNRIHQIFGTTTTATRAAAQAFTLFYAKAAVAGTAVSVLAGALSSLVGGLGAVAAAAAQASGVLAVLPGAISAAAQGALAGVIAFKGIGAAISAGFKSATEQAKGNVTETRRVQDAQQRLGDAMRRLQEARIRGAERMQDAEQKVADATQDVVRAQRDLTSAQRALTAARREAQEELQQLNFSVEDAALAEERAAISLERAYERYQAVQDLPADNRSRREAELAFKETELNYRQAKDRSSDLQEEQKKAAQSGIKGTRAYSTAYNDVVGAQNRLVEAEQRLNQARIDQARAAADVQRDIAAAQRGVAEAQQGIARAVEDSTAATNKYNEALKNLTPSAQSFVIAFVALQDVFKQFRRALQEPFFAEFSTAFFGGLTGMMSVARPALAETAAVIGRLGAALFTAMGSAQSLSLFGQILEGNNRILGVFLRDLDGDGKTVVSELVELLLKLAVAIQPITERFTVWLGDLIEIGNNNSTITGMTAALEKAGDAAAVFGDAFGAVFRLFKNISVVAAPFGIELVESFTKAASAKADFFGSNEGAKALQTYFTGINENVKAIGGFLGDIGAAFLRMGDNPAIAETFTILRDAVPHLETLFTAAIDAGPALARLVVSVSKFFATFADKGGTGAVTTFFDTITFVVDGLTSILDKIPGRLIFVLGSIFAVVKAIAILRLGFMLVMKILLGGVTNLFFAFKRGLSGFKAAGAVLTRKTSLRDAFRSGKGGNAAGVSGGGGIGGETRVLTVLEQILASINRCCSLMTGAGAGGAAEGEKQQRQRGRHRTRSRFRFGRGGAAGAADTIGVVDARGAAPAAAAQTARAGRTAGALGKLGTVFKGLGSGAKLLGGAFRVLGFGLRFLTGPIGMLVFTFGPLLFSMLVKLYAKSATFRTIVDALWKAISVGANFVWQNLIKFFAWLSTNWRKIPDAFKAAWSAVRTAWNNTIGFFKGIPRAITRAMSGMWDGIKSSFRSVWTWIRERFEALVNYFRKAPERIAKAFQSLGSKISVAVGTGLGRLFEWINKHLIGNLNKVVGFFSDKLKIPELPTTVRAFAKGGYVSGPGGPTDDKIPARLSNGEYVLRSSAVRSVGRTALDKLNSGSADAARGGINLNPLDWAGAGLRKLGGWVKRGMGYAVDKVFGAVLGLTPPGIRGNGLAKFVIDAVQGLRDVARTWGHKRDDTLSAAASGAGSRRQILSSGWSRPILRYRVGGGLGSYAGHTGQDFPAPFGTPIYAASLGELTTMRRLTTSYGRHIILRHAGGVSTLYAHMDRFAPGLSTQRLIKPGQLIGYVDSTGNSTGNHLHFEVRQNGRYLSPTAFLRSKGVRMAGGGIVRATPGGVLSLIGEAGRHERVEPLDRQGLSTRDRALIAALSDGGGGGGGRTEVRVYIGSQELRDIVGYEVVKHDDALARTLVGGRRR